MKTLGSFGFADVHDIVLAKQTMHFRDSNPYGRMA
jgi:hypothetical protein